MTQQSVPPPLDQLPPELQGQAERILRTAAGQSGGDPYAGLAAAISRAHGTAWRRPDGALRLTELILRRLPEAVDLFQRLRPAPARGDARRYSGRAGRQLRQGQAGVP